MFKSHILRKSGKISIFEEVTLFKFAHYLFVGEDSCTKEETKHCFEKNHFLFEILTTKIRVIFERFSFFDIFITLELNYRQHYRKKHLYLYLD